MNKIYNKAEQNPNILYRIPIATETSCGPKRKENQDCVSNYIPGLLIVADGVGGEKKGDYASQLLCFMARNPDYFEDDVLKVHMILNDENSIRNMRMATTFVAAVEDTQNPNHHTVYNVGDSTAIVYDLFNRIYSEVSIRDEISKGDGSDKKIVNNFVGGNGSLNKSKIHKTEVFLMKGQCLLLMTDGLMDAIDDRKINHSEIINILKEGSSTAPSKLINLANNRHGKDNVTVGIISHQ